MDTELVALQRRLDELARTNLRLRRGGIAAALVLLAILAIVSGPRAAEAEGPKVLEAEGLVLRDSSGRKRATLRVREDGSVGLALLAVGQDAPRAGFELDAQGIPRFALMSDGHPIVTLVAGPHGPALILWDKADDPRPRCSLGVEEGAAMLRLYGSDALPRVSLSTLRDGAAGLLFTDSAKRDRVSIGTGDDATSMLELHGPDGVRVFKAP